MRLRTLALCAVMTAATTAAAQGRTPKKQRIEEALPHFQRGVDLYDENDFTNALIEFRRAYKIAQDYHVLYNVAQTCYQLQNYACALDAFQRYVSEGGSHLARDRRAYVDKEISKLKTRVAQVRVTVNVPGADILVDDEKVGTSPLDHPLVVSQGKRKISAVADGKPPVSRTIEIAGGDSTSITLEVQSETAAPPPPPPPPDAALGRDLAVPTHRPVPWIAWGVAGGLAAAWAATGVVALVYSSDAQSKLGTYGVTASDITSAQDSAKIFALVSDISLGCTVIAVGVATVLTLLAKPVPIEKPTASAHLLVGPTGIGVVGRF
jgi:hypothetical protein